MHVGFCEWRLCGTLNLVSSYTLIMIAYVVSFCGRASWILALNTGEIFLSFGSTCTAEYCQKLCAWLDAVTGHVTEPFLLNSLGNVWKQKQAAVSSSGYVLVVQPVHLGVLNLKCFTSETTLGPSVLLIAELLWNKQVRRKLTKCLLNKWWHTEALISSKKACISHCFS